MVIYNRPSEQLCTAHEVGFILILAMILVLVLSSLTIALIAEVRLQQLSRYHVSLSTARWQALENLVMTVSAHPQELSERRLMPYQNELELGVWPQCYANCAMQDKQTCWLWRVVARDHDARIVTSGVITEARLQSSIQLPPCQYSRFTRSRNQLLWLQRDWQ